MTTPRLLLVPALLAAGCACNHDRVVLLPDAEGRVGQIAVIQGERQTLIDRAYGSVRTDDRGRAQAEQLDAASVRAGYGAELAALPPRPRSWFLYFVGDSSELTAESQEQFPAILREIAARPAAEVSVIGHTDTRGSAEYNDGLSLERAMAVHQQILELGVDHARVTTAGRGERELAVPTGDEVGEPRNRRVEIGVR